MSQSFKTGLAVACTVLALLGSVPATVHAQCAPGTVPVDISVTTDTWGNETTWELLDVTTSTMIGTGGPYPIFAPGTFTDSFCVDPNDCYNFTIYDAYGDGICCFWGSGSYSVSFDGTEVGSSDDIPFQFGDQPFSRMCHPFGLAPNCTCPAAPPNDDICTAQDIACGESIVGQNLTANGDTFLTQFGFLTFCNNAVWYRHVGTGACTTASTCSFADYFSALVVVREIPGTNFCPGVAPTVEWMFLESSFTCGFGTELTWNAAAGEVYYIAVVSFCGVNPAHGNFELSLTCVAPPLNDAVCAAKELLDGVPLAFNNACASAQPGEVNPGPGTGPNGSCNSDDGWCAFELGVTNSLWYSFIAPPSGCVSIFTDADSVGLDLQLAVYQATDCTDFSTFVEVAGNDDDGPGFEPALNNLSCLNPGETYLVQLDGFFGTGGSGFLNLVDCGTEPLAVDAGACQSRIINDLDDRLDLNYLCAISTGGAPPVTFEWSVESGDEQSIRWSDGGACIAVQPNETTTYCVTGTDAFDCSRTDCVTVTVIDPVCGHNGDKVTVCHVPPGNPANAHEICIDYCGLDAHLSNHDGDVPGPCGNPCTATNPAILPCADMTISVTTDTWGNETTWELVDTDLGGPIASGGPYPAFSPQTFVEELCVNPQHCYEFTIFDAYGDGICCFWGPGNYNINFQGTDYPSPSGGQFGSSETVSNIGDACAAPPPPMAMAKSQGQPLPPLSIHGGRVAGDKGLFLDVVMAPRTSDPHVRAEIVAGNQVIVSLHDGPVEAGTVYTLRGSLQDGALPGLSAAGGMERPLAVRISSTNGGLDHKTSLTKVFEGLAAGRELPTLPAGVPVVPSSIDKAQRVRTPAVGVAPATVAPSRLQVTVPTAEPVEGTRARSPRAPRLR